MSEQIEPVQDFATDWDHNDPEWVADPYPIWDDLRERCPMAHSDRFNEGAWLPVGFDTITAIAADTETFSNVHHGIRRGGTTERGHFPPINSDPPEHLQIRRTLLPFFNPKRIEHWREHITADCQARALAIAERGEGDAAVDYAQHIPVGAIAAIMGIDPADGDQFRAWLFDIVGGGADDADNIIRAVTEVRAYMADVMKRRRNDPGPDLISHLVTTDIEGEPLDDELIELMLVLQLVAGIDTTWSSIGAALAHLAEHPDDRQRLIDEPELMPQAVEEFLRAYAPVNVARRVTQATEIDGVSLAAGDHIMMAFPIACRDPEQFEDADKVVLDRTKNRHIAFGSGIHRCLGSNLARLEMEISITTFLQHVPDFSIAPDESVTWAPGQIRGPRSIPIVVNR